MCNSYSVMMEWEVYVDFLSQAGFSLGHMCSNTSTAYKHSQLAWIHTDSENLAEGYRVFYGK